MWNRHRALSHDHTFRNDLNSSLRSEVDLFMNREILSSNSMFSKVSDSVLIAIVSTLQNQVFLEGDYIIRKGQWGEEMYFILSGKAGARINGSVRINETTTPANTRNVLCQVMNVSNHSATGAPNTCPPLPAAVTIASDIDRFSSVDARPTTASTTPNPVPAMPKPTSHA